MTIGPWVRTLAACGFLFLLGPIVIVCILSVSADDYLGFPPSGVSLRWFAALAANADILRATRVSAGLAAIVTAASLAAGVPAAFAVARGRAPGIVALAVAAPLLLPTVVIGLALLLALHPLGLIATWPGLALAHLVIVLPLVVRIMVTAFGALPVELEAAAATLGASPARAFLRVTLPLSLPGLVAAATLAFLVSFDETVMSLFLTGPRLTTLPVALFRYAESRTDPLIAALAVALIVLTLAIVLLVERVFGMTRALGRG